jgi:tRNA threonylcarbamoyladenosine biosynthesis protein TsaE
MEKIISQSEKETQDIGFGLAKSLKGGETIALTGNLGSGKTIFSKGLARGLGVRKIITSPTFVLMKVYKIEGHHMEIENFIHVDAYRLKKESDLKEIGLLDWLNKKNSIVVIEWSEKVKKILPKTAIEIKIILGKKETERHFTIKQ